MSQTGVARKVVVAVVVFAHCCIWMSGDARGERVGYSFGGNFFQPPPKGSGPLATDYNVFGFHFPFDAPFNGTFSYDASSPASNQSQPEADTRDFKQAIQGGFTFNVLNSDGVTPIFRLTANAYVIKVSNDVTASGAPVASDLVSVVFNTLEDPTLPPIIRDDTAYTKKPVSIVAPLSWDWTMFNDLDEPKLRADLPAYSGFPYTGSILATGLASFEITSLSQLSPSTADYNVDGQIANNDYQSWRSAFGKTSPDYEYADGNRDGVVDAADYVFWRHASDVGALGAGSSAVPEPATALLTAISLLILAGFRRRRILCA